MRVIGGRARGTKLLGAEGFGGTRPITDRAKESLFNILAPRIQGARFLDLFAGTGSVGIEALSRGAESATFVELNRQPLRTLTQNLNRVHVERQAKVVQADVFDFLRRSPTAFDIVFVAPPQWQGLWRRALQALDDRPQWITNDGVMVLHCDPKELVDAPLATLQRTDHRRYGNVMLGFYAWSEVGT